MSNQNWIHLYTYLVSLVVLSNFILDYENIRLYLTGFLVYLVIYHSFAEIIEKLDKIASSRNFD